MNTYRIEVTRIVTDLLAGGVEVEASSRSEALFKAKALWHADKINLEFSQHEDSEAPEFEIADGPQDPTQTFDDAKAAFADAPTRATAGAYLATAMEYEADDMIGDDTFLDALAEIRNWLLTRDDAVTIQRALFDQVSTALGLAEAFMSGFEGDESQETLDDDLEKVRAAEAAFDAYGEPKGEQS